MAENEMATPSNSGVENETSEQEVITLETDTDDTASGINGLGTRENEAPKDPRVYDFHAWNWFYLKLTDPPYECPWCIRRIDNGGGRACSGILASYTGARQHFKHYDHNLWRHTPEIIDKPPQLLPEGVTNPERPADYNSDLERQEHNSRRIATGPRTYDRGPGSPWYMARFGDAPRSSPYKPSPRKKKRRTRIGMTSWKQQQRARERRKLLDGAYDSSDYDPASPLPSGTSPNALPGNRGTMGITVLPSIHGRGRHPRLGGAAVSTEVRNPLGRESTLTWSEAQRQVEIDTKQLGEKRPRDDRLERLTITEDLMVDDVETELEELFPPESSPDDDVILLDAPPEIPDDVNRRASEEKDRQLAEEEQEAERLKALQSSPSRRTRSKSTDKDVVITDQTSDKSDTVAPSPMPHPSPLVSPSPMSIDSPLPSSPSKRGRGRPRKHSRTMPFVKKLITTVDLGEGEELPAVQFDDGLLNAGRKIKLDENYFFHSLNSPERVHQRALCQPNSPKKEDADETMNLYEGDCLEEEEPIERQKGRVIEYDLDDEDTAWLQAINKRRRLNAFPEIEEGTVERLIDELERESVFDLGRDRQSAYDPASSSVLRSPDAPDSPKKRRARNMSRDSVSSQSSAEEPVADDEAVCCVCGNGDCSDHNQILFCEMCNVAVHQECYGVPYIPEGPWLCRRCQHSPSKAVTCALCPNKTGAFKQIPEADGGGWCHVSCALWIPEVQFGNTVFLEPIEHIHRVPKSRWTLKCFICKKTRVGAAIQCHKAHCYKAFHVSCGQKAGLYMSMDTNHMAGAQGQMTVQIIKNAFCQMHSPDDWSPKPLKSTERVLSRKKLKAGETEDRVAIARKMINSGAERPILCAPYVPVGKIGSTIQRECQHIPGRGQFLQHLLAYWTQKRLARSGVPLLRRLQNRISKPTQSADNEASPSLEALREQLQYWKTLRQDLERVRLLIELVRKREKYKRDIIKYHEEEVQMRCFPLNAVLSDVIEQLKDADVSKIFSHPVTEDEAPFYFSIIAKPMDLSTMSEKIENFGYHSLFELRQDLDLIVANCFTYNDKNSVITEWCKKLKDAAVKILKKAALKLDAIGIDYRTGQKSGFPGCSIPFASKSLTPKPVPYYESIRLINLEISQLENVKMNASLRTKRLNTLKREKRSIEADICALTQKYGLDFDSDADRDGEETMSTHIVERCEKESSTLENEANSKELESTIIDADVMDDGDCGPPVVEIEEARVVAGEPITPDSTEKEPCASTRFNEAMGPLISAHQSRRNTSHKLSINDIKGPTTTLTRTESKESAMDELLNDWYASEDEPENGHSNFENGYATVPEMRESSDQNGHSEEPTTIPSSACVVWLRNHRPALLFRDKSSGMLSTPPEVKSQLNGHAVVNGNGHAAEYEHIYVKYFDEDAAWFQYNKRDVFGPLGMAVTIDQAILRDCSEEILREYQDAIRYLVTQGKYGVSR